MGLDLDDIGERLRAELTAKHSARERALPLSRETIRFAANSIRATHRLEFDTARDLLDKCRASVHTTRAILADHLDIYHAGFARDAEKEFVEASILFSIIAQEPLPGPSDLDVSAAAYLNGLGEAASELRRYTLDQLRHRTAADLESTLAAMDDVYSLLVTMDFPDALTGGLRRTTDLVRGVLERTRGDLTLAAQQAVLEARLLELQAHIAPA